jgi:hypothetical protein
VHAAWSGRTPPFAAWLRNHSNQEDWDAAWLEDDHDETAGSWPEWGYPRLCAALARDGRIDLLQWVRSHDPPCPFGWQTGCEAFQSDDQEMDEWLEAHGYGPEESLEWDVDGTLSIDAGVQGDLPLLMWLDAHGCVQWLDSFIS